MKRPRFAVDFDGTLVVDEKYPEIGPFLPGAVNAVRALERVGEVVIFSCRTTPHHHVTGEPRSEEAVEQEVNAIRAKLREVGLGHLEIWSGRGKPPAAAYIDNLGIAFRGDWDTTLEDVFELIAPYTHTLEMRFREPSKTVMDEYVEARNREDNLADDLQEFSPAFYGIPIVGSPAVPQDVVLFVNRKSTNEPLDSVTIAGWEEHRPQGGHVWASEEEKALLDALDAEPDMEQYGIKAMGEVLFGSAINMAGAEPLERHPNSQRFHELCEEDGILHDRKQADYGSDDDPFANIRRCERMGIPAWVGNVIRMGDKQSRLEAAVRQWVEGRQVKLANEGVVDSFADQSVYSKIGRVLFEEWAAEQEATS